MRYELDKKLQLINFEYKTTLDNSSNIKNNFCNIWNNIIQKTGLDFDVKYAIKEFKDLVVYEALDGSRSTLISTQDINREMEGALYVINFINTLHTLGAKNCFIMIHTSYNRNRGNNEFKKILKCINNGANLIKRYAIENNIRCSCICINKNYELMNLLNEVSESTSKGEFCANFLFDYNEEWAMTKKGKDVIKNFPDIDVHIRHTKLQFSGGWIPGKMSRSAFLYSQNGSTYSNWDSDEIVALLAISLLAKILHK